MVRGSSPYFYSLPWMTTVSRKTSRINDVDVALLGERHERDGVTALRDANVMREAELDQVLEPGPEVDPGLELDQAVVAQQMALGCDRSTYKHRRFVAYSY